MELLIQKFDDFKIELKNEKSNHAEDLMDADASITENAEAILNLNKKLAAIEETISNDLESKLNQKLSIKVSDFKNEVEKLSSLNEDEKKFLETEIDFLHKNVIATSEEEKHLVEEVETFEHQVTDFSNYTLNAMTSNEKVLAELQQKQLMLEQQLTQIQLTTNAKLVTNGILDDIKMYMQSLMLKDSATQIMQNVVVNKENKNFFEDIGKKLRLKIITGNEADDILIKTYIDLQDILEKNQVPFSYWLSLIKLNCLDFEMRMSSRHIFDYNEFLEFVFLKFNSVAYFQAKLAEISNFQFDTNSLRVYFLKWIGLAKRYKFVKASTEIIRAKMQTVLLTNNLSTLIPKVQAISLLNELEQFVITHLPNIAFNLEANSSTDHSVTFNKIENKSSLKYSKFSQKRSPPNKSFVTYWCRKCGCQSCRSSFAKFQANKNNNKHNPKFTKSKIAITYPKDSYIYEPLLKTITKNFPNIEIEDKILVKGDYFVFHYGDYEDLDHERLMSDSKYITNSYIYRKSLIRKHYLSNTIAVYKAKHLESVLNTSFPESFQFELTYAEFLDDTLDEVYELRCELMENEEKKSNGIEIQLEDGEHLVEVDDGCPLIVDNSASDGNQATEDSIAYNKYEQNDVKPHPFDQFVNSQDDPANPRQCYISDDDSESESQ
jgi:hypothetical protein